MKNKIRIFLISLYFLFLFLSFIFGFNSGKQIGYNLFSFAKDMIKVLPSAFILIGLFEVWVKRETVIKHLGKESGIMAYIWVIILASGIVGGLYVAFPIAYSLFKKGAKLSVVFTYIGAASVCRIPMTIFESSFMGIKFSLIRLLVATPLVIFSSIILGNYLEKQNYQIKDGNN